MSDIGFTKGPWYTTRDFDGAIDGVFSMSTGREVFLKNQPDAHLISAAPDMFFYVKERADKGCADAKLICAKAQGQDTSNGEG